MAFANPYYQNQYQMPQYQARDWPMLKGRPVTSIDEVRASQVDFDGSVSYFPDTAHNTIYTKQINLDGTASIHAYALVEDKQDQAMSLYEEWECNTLKKLIDCRSSLVKDGKQYLSEMIKDVVDEISYICSIKY